jgi:hypothetical protein
MADSLNAGRERQREQDAEVEAQRQEWKHEVARYQRELAHENAQLAHNLEVARLKTQAEVVVAAVNRGLADHQNVEYLMSELRTVAKQLENASANVRQEMNQGKSPKGPKHSAHPKHSARPERFDIQADENVIEAEIVSDDSGDFGARGDAAKPGPREEDLGS